MVVPRGQQQDGGEQPRGRSRSPNRGSWGDNNDQSSGGNSWNDKSGGGSWNSGSWQSDKSDGWKKDDGNSDGGWKRDSDWKKDDGGWKKDDGNSDWKKKDWSDSKSGDSWGNDWKDKKDWKEKKDWSSGGNDDKQEICRFFAKAGWCKNADSCKFKHVEGGAKGDWDCPQCGDHQFARNLKCRQCGATRPGAESDPAADAKAELREKLINSVKAWSNESEDNQETWWWWCDINGYKEKYDPRRKEADFLQDFCDASHNGVKVTMIDGLPPKRNWGGGGAGWTKDDWSNKSADQAQTPAPLIAPGANPLLAAMALAMSAGSLPKTAPPVFPGLPGFPLPGLPGLPVPGFPLPTLS